VRLGDLWRRDEHGHRLLTWRELRAYVRQLPPQARTRIAMGDSDGLWGVGEHLAALTLDALHVANWQRANEGKKRGEQSPYPKPVARPGTKRRQDRNSPERRAKREAARQRAAERRAAIERGEIT
jgi:hypothetical protein